MDKIEVGRMGERQAALYLSNKGWKILIKNYRLKVGEIDIVAIDPSGVFVFIEVKSMSGANTRNLSPEDNLSKFKLFKTKRVSQMFVAKHWYFFEKNTEWRIDLIAINFIKDNKMLVRHYKNI